VKTLDVFWLILTEKPEIRQERRAS